jgi:hypothetical protein
MHSREEGKLPSATIRRMVSIVLVSNRLWPAASRKSLNRGTATARPHEQSTEEPAADAVTGIRVPQEQSTK